MRATRAAAPASASVFSPRRGSRLARDAQGTSPRGLVDARGATSRGASRRSRTPGNYHPLRSRTAGQKYQHKQLEKSAFVFFAIARLTRRRSLPPYRVPRDAQPQAAVALFGKKAPAGPKKAAVKPMVGKPKPKPAAKKPVAAKKPAANKPAAKKPAAKKPAAKPLFSFGTAKKAAPKSATASKSKYTITKTAGTVKKAKPTTFKTVNIGAKKPMGVKPMGVKPMGGAKPVAPKPKPAVYDRDTVGTAGVASIFAGTFLLTLAALPAATEAALEVIGIGYSGYFLYNWVANPESRGEFDKTLTKIDDETGINLKKVASVTGDLVSDASKALAASAEKSAEASAAAKAAKAKEVKAEAKKEVAAAPAAASDAKKTFKEAVKEAVKDADK